MVSTPDMPLIKRIVKRIVKRKSPIKRKTAVKRKSPVRRTVSTRRTPAPIYRHRRKSAIPVRAALW